MAWATCSTSSTCADTTGSVWYSWVLNTGSNCTSTASTITTCSSPTSNAVWTIWVDDGPSQIVNQGTCHPDYYSYRAPAVHEAPRQTPEQQAAAAEAAAQAEAERVRVNKEEQERKAVAAKRAMELLRENLSKKQREALDKNGWFLVEGGKSKKTYRIQGDRCAGNITELEGEQAVARYCVHASYEIPLGDQLLAQAISLRYDEEYLLKIANKTSLRQAA
jgi:hypothetical protein